jgi:DNA-binding GntR family transcriptional regulator
MIGMSDPADLLTNTGVEPEPLPRAASLLHDEVLSKLRDYIVQGNLADGARVPERQLCDMFGISRTPLREALKVLAAEGMIDLLPNRGARVKVLSSKDLRELFDIIGGLEALAGRLACEGISNDEIGEIETLHYRMYRYYVQRNLTDYFRCNQLIHESILKAARNEALCTTYASFAGRIRRARFAANLDKQRDRWGQAMREHETILEALRRRAGDELSNILFLHLRNKQKIVLENIEMHPSV